MLRLADSLRRRGKLDQAQPWWRKAAAKAGNTRAMTNLSKLLMLRGEPAEAEPWARNAAVLGDIGAMNLLGCILLQRGEPAEAQTWWRKAAHAGNTNAANNLLAFIKAKSEAGEDALRKVIDVQWDQANEAAL
jgi:Flp pilus assembly protein TadD